MDTESVVILALEEEAELLRRSLGFSRDEENKKQWQRALTHVDSLLKKYQHLEETRHQFSDPVAALYNEAHELQADLNNNLDRNLFESTTITAFRKHLEHILTLIEAITEQRPNLKLKPEIVIEPESLSWEENDINEIKNDPGNDETDSFEYDLSDEDELDHQEDLDRQFALGLAYEEHYNQILTQNLSPALAEVSFEKEIENIDKFAHEQTLARFHAPSLQQFGIFNQQQSRIAPTPAPTPQLTPQLVPQMTPVPALQLRADPSLHANERDLFHDAFSEEARRAEVEYMSEEEFEKWLENVNHQVQVKESSLASSSVSLLPMPKPGHSCGKEEREQERLVYRTLPSV